MNERNIFKFLLFRHSETANKWNNEFDYWYQYLSQLWSDATLLRITTRAIIEHLIQFIAADSRLQLHA